MIAPPRILVPDRARRDVPRVGAMVATGDGWRPWQLVDPGGAVVEPVDDYFSDLMARGRSVATLRSYGMDLLAWFRFLWSLDIEWNRATRDEARDFTRWQRLTTKPRGASATTRASPGSVNPTTGKPVPKETYAASTRAHAETVGRLFYEFHREVGTGPIINPFPLARHGGAERANAHHNPMEPYRREQSGLYRPKVPKRIPRSIPDEWFDALFAILPSNRDRALVALYVSSGARAAELLGLTQGGADPGRQLITVERKGSRAIQQIPASTDAFVWLRLYQEEIRDLVPRGRDQPLWWTLRQPIRPLTYHALYAMFRRVNAALGTNWTLHDLRHTAAYRLASDPLVPLTDVQWILGHAELTTTQIYLTPRAEDVVEHVLAFYERRSRQQPVPTLPRAEGSYRPESLDVLFRGPLT